MSALLDWEAVEQPVLPGYDVILGADLMYIKQAAPQLASVIPKVCIPADVEANSQTQGQRRGSLLLMADPEIRTPQNRYSPNSCSLLLISSRPPTRTCLLGMTQGLQWLWLCSAVTRVWHVRLPQAPMLYAHCQSCAVRTFRPHVYRHILCWYSHKAVLLQGCLCESLLR